MCIKKIEAYSFDGKTFSTEGAAIAAAVGKLLDNTGVAQKVIDNSSALLPYLQRIIEIETERHSAEKPVEAEPEEDNHPIPELVYWNARLGTFFGLRGVVKGGDFYESWYERRHEFPEDAE